jgi:hypothetical protein
MEDGETYQLARSFSDRAAPRSARLIRFHISDDGPPTFIDVDVLDANELRASLAKPS